MDVNTIFRIAAIGIVVAVLNQVLIKAERQEQAMMVTLAGLLVVLAMIVKGVGSLFDEVKTMFGLTRWI